MNRRVVVLTVAILGCAGLVVAAIFAPIGSRDSHSAASKAETPKPLETESPKPQPGEAVDTPPPPLTDAPAEPPQGMVWVPGGAFRMGSDPVTSPENPDRIKRDELPAHEVELDGYWINLTEVTNREYDEFVRMTGYVTAAEKPLTPAEIARSGIDLALAQGQGRDAGSMCFNPQFNRRAIQLRDSKTPLWEYELWNYVEGANWRNPDGPGSGIASKMDHPVVHISWEDAVAYCQWAGKELPTEAQWEYASRGGRSVEKYPWGNEREPDGKYQCNYWQGVFPNERLNLDGFETTAPVKSFSPNGFGLYDMGGNVWEWCADFYDEGYYARSPRRNPPGPKQSYDSREPDIIKRSIRGGSFLCNVNSCTGYRCSARMGAEFNSGTFHTGFRAVVNPGQRSEYDAAQQKIAQWRQSQAASPEKSSIP